MEDRVELDAFKEVQGTSLMTGTGVTYRDILQAVCDFNEYAISGKGGLFSFFNKKHLSNKVLKAFALIGMKHVTDELYTKMKGKEGGNKKDSSDKT